MRVGGRGADPDVWAVGLGVAVAATADGRNRKLPEGLGVQEYPVHQPYPERWKRELPEGLGVTSRVAGVIQSYLHGPCPGHEQSTMGPMGPLGSLLAAPI